eukprot:2820172-Prymnesium_polylepis.1
MNCAARKCRHARSCAASASRHAELRRSSLCGQRATSARRSISSAGRLSSVATQSGGEASSSVQSCSLSRTGVGTCPKRALERSRCARALCGEATSISWFREHCTNCDLHGLCCARRALRRGWR